MARNLRISLCIALLALGACTTESVSPDPKLPGATETNVHHSACDPDGDAAAIKPDAICEEDAGEPLRPCKTIDDCEPGERCTGAGFCHMNRVEPQ